jgi:transcriptional regulator of acetoin/glycerol metabolism
VATGSLTDRRRRLERAWRARFGEGAAVEDVRDDVLASWERSAASAPADLAAAPVDESQDPTELWRHSPLRPAIEALQDEIRELAEDRGFVAAVMDDEGRLVWTAGGRHMRQRAETVNFAPGGRWDEASVGTNALAMALDEDRPVQVFSAEHYAAMVHGWCCFAAPLHDPATGRPLGVLDLSSTWDRAHPMALAAVRALARAAQAVLDAEARARVPLQSAATLQVSVLGRRELRRGGVVVPLAQRQAEVLTLLALAEDGLTPEQLHDQLHGELSVSLVTTKADVSHLRALLGGGITHRVYRLEADVAVDVVALREALREGSAERIAALYAGSLLPSSESPGIREWREVLDVAVRDVALRSGLPSLAERLPYDVAVQEAAAAALAPHDPRAGWAAARLARAVKD